VEVLKMATEFEIYTGVDGVVLQSKSWDANFELEVWSRRFLTFDYGNWSVIIDSDDIKHTALRLNLWFTNRGSILFSCDNYCEENREDADECCKYKDLEITDNFSIENDYFTIKLIKNQPQTTQKTSVLPEEFKIGIKPNKIALQAKLKETEFKLKTQRNEFLRLNYNGWGVFVESDDIDYTNLALQFTNDGKILFSCDNHNSENADKYCKYKNFEIVDNCKIQNNHFTVAFFQQIK
jgi:hypothetical protein